MGAQMSALPPLAERLLCDAALNAGKLVLERPPLGRIADTIECLVSMGAFEKNADIFYKITPIGWSIITDGR